MSRTERPEGKHWRYGPPPTAEQRAAMTSPMQRWIPADEDGPARMGWWATTGWSHAPVGWWRPATAQPPGPGREWSGGPWPTIIGPRWYFADGSECDPHPAAEGMTWRPPSSVWVVQGGSANASAGVWAKLETYADEELRGRGVEYRLDDGVHRLYNCDSIAVGVTAAFDAIAASKGECPLGTHATPGEAFACGRCSAVVRRAQREDVRAERRASDALLSSVVDAMDGKPEPIRSDYPTAAEVKAHATIPTAGAHLGAWLDAAGQLWLLARELSPDERVHGPFTPLAAKPCAWPTVRTRADVLAELGTLSPEAARLVAELEGVTDAR